MKFKIIFSKTMKFLLVTLIFLNNQINAQKDTTKSSFYLKLNAINHTGFLGNELKLDLNYSLSKRSEIGIGINYFILHFKPQSRYYDLNYKYLAFFLNYNILFNKRNNLILNIGKPFLTYFDSDYMLNLDGLFHFGFWPNSKDVNHYLAIKRPKSWFLVNTIYEFNFSKNISVFSGFTYYVNFQRFYWDVNIGTAFKINLK
jgi:hypothetical protein